jgi:hypothetical protein
MYVYQTYTSVNNKMSAALNWISVKKLISRGGHSLLLYSHNRDTRADTRITQQASRWEESVIAKPQRWNRR